MPNGGVLNIKFLGVITQWWGIAQWWGKLSNGGTFGSV